MRDPTAWLRRFGAGAIAALAFALLPAGAFAGTITIIAGHTTEASGLTANYKIEVPSNWNGTLVLYSHGYDSFTVPLPATDAGDPATGAYLLSQGYALAGSAYAKAGWSLEEAFQDQTALLDVFKDKVGKPTRTIAWGHSLGGMITAGLVQLHPERFQGAIPMCGVVAGGPGVWNEFLDSEFALSTLVAPFKLVNFTAADVGTISPFNPGPAFLQAEGVIGGAQATAAGRARVALAVALANVPGWFDQATPEPAATDYATREANQFAWLANVDFLFAYFGRFELETRAGGNYSWNTGVNYKQQLTKSIDRAEVEALYKAAGLDLQKDLAKLNDAPRIAAEPKAVGYVSKFIAFNGDLDMPVLTMHTSGDGLVEPSGEQAYASVVKSADDSSLLRQVYVHRAGHCTFTPAETISAFKTLIRRLDTGHWAGTNPAAMNAQATELGASLNVAPASFFEYRTGRFMRPFFAPNVGEEDNSEGQR